MQKLLIQKETNCVYFWTEELAARDDMEEYKPAAKKVAAPEPVEEVKAEEDIKQMAKAVLTKKAKE